MCGAVSAVFLLGLLVGFGGEESELASVAGTAAPSGMQAASATVVVFAVALEELLVERDLKVELLVGLDIERVSGSGGRPASGRSCVASAVVFSQVMVPDSFAGSRRAGVPWG